MQTIDVTIRIRAPIERVWELISDHESYTFFKNVSEAKLLKEGTLEKNGLGAVRKVRVLGVTFVEDIVAFDPPKCLEYRVKKCTLPIRHEIGCMTLANRGEGTDIHWVTRFETPIPLVGRILAPILRGIFSKEFRSCLKQAKTRLEA